MNRPAFALSFLLGSLLPGLALAQAPSATAASEGAQKDEEPTFQLSLEEAYKKELAFLLGQKRQLKAQLEGSTERFSARESEVESTLSGLENRLLGLDSSIQEARTALTEADRAAQNAGDDEELVGATLSQAITSLSDNGVEVEKPASMAKDEEPSAEDVEQIFGAALEALKGFSSVEVDSGASMYLQDGTKTEGTVARVGRIAAYGLTDAVAGALAPAGGGELKIWKDPAEDAAKALAGQGSAEHIGIFLFESISTAVSEDTEQTTWEHVDAGGAIAWVIVGLGFLGLILAVLRALILMRAGGNQDKVEAELSPLLREGRAAEAARVAGGFRGSAANVAHALFRALSTGSDKIDEALSEGMLGEARRVERFGTVILVIAAVSPLLGLLGTVTGMISTFDVITKFGTGDPKMLSGGISTALITTELGLIVAIPTLLLGSLLKGWAESIQGQAEQTALKLVTLYTGETPPDRD